VLAKENKLTADIIELYLISSLNHQKDALIIKIYSVIKLYIFRASSLPIIRSFLLYIRQWYSSFGT